MTSRTIAACVEPIAYTRRLRQKLVSPLLPKRLLALIHAAPPRKKSILLLYHGPYLRCLLRSPFFYEFVPS